MSVGLFTTITGLGRKNWRGGFRLITYFVSYTKQANLKRNWLFDYGLGFGNYKSEDDSKIVHTVFPIISFEYVF